MQEYLMKNVLIDPFLFIQLHILNIQIKIKNKINNKIITHFIRLPTI
jgi:hypothetical protein